MLINEKGISGNEKEMVFPVKNHLLGKSSRSELFDDVVAAELQKGHRVLTAFCGDRGKGGELLGGHHAQLGGDRVDAVLATSRQGRSTATGAAVFSVLLH